MTWACAVHVIKTGKTSIGCYPLAHISIKLRVITQLYWWFIVNSNSNSRTYPLVFYFKSMATRTCVLHRQHSSSQTSCQPPTFCLKYNRAVRGKFACLLLLTTAALQQNWRRMKIRAYLGIFSWNSIYYVTPSPMTFPIFCLLLVHQLSKTSKRASAKYRNSTALSASEQGGNRELHKTNKEQPAHSSKDE